RFDDALRWRIERLGPTERHVLEFLALSGGPLSLAVLRNALCVPTAQVRRVLDEMHDAQLVTLTGRAESDLVDAYHSRFRPACLALLTETDRVHAHERLAIALETTQSTEFDALAEHWAAAGAKDTAARYRLRAADRAVDALAFARASALYQRILQADTLDREQTVLVRTKLAESLANCGRGEAAAEAYSLAAKDSTASEALALEQLAADQLVRSGLLDRGLDALSRVLARVGESLPTSRARAFAAILVMGLWLRLRGFAFTARRDSEISPQARMRLGALATASECLSIVDPLLGAAISKHYLLLSLRTGAAPFVARALAVGAWHLAVRGVANTKRSEAVFARARAIAEASAVRLDIAYVDGIQAIAHFTRASYRRAADLSERSQNVLHESGRAFAWALNVQRSYNLRTRWILGDLREGARLRREYLNDAFERRDLHAIVELSTGEAALFGLLRDDAATVKRESRDAIQRWSKRGFHLEHHRALQTAVITSLCMRAPREACERIDEAWPAFTRSLLGRVEMVSLDAQLMRVRAWLALAVADKAARPTVLPNIMRALAKLRRPPLPSVRAQADVIEAGCLALTARSNPKVPSALRAALAVFEQHEMALLTEITRLALAEIIEGDEGALAAKRAKDWFREQGLKSPARLAAAHAPGLIDPG
ncbi:MAG: hypothetical protein ACHREM_04985, partial [Polyangiales bacterium]